MRLVPTVVALAILIGIARPAAADATVFLGTMSNPSNRLTRGFGVGISLLIVGFEFEYGTVSEDDLEATPALTTGMGNLLVQTPGSIQFYFTAGGGAYRERLLEHQETNFGINTGGGVKIPLVGPLRLRLDYRLFKLQGSPLYSQTHRFYAGANLRF